VPRVSLRYFILRRLVLDERTDWRNTQCGLPGRPHNKEPACLRLLCRVRSCMNYSHKLSKNAYCAVSEQQVRIIYCRANVG